MQRELQILFGIVTSAIFLAGCAGMAVPPPAARPMQPAQPQNAAYCRDLRIGLPNKDPMFDLKGSITYRPDFGGSLRTQKIVQFGIPDQYISYMASPRDCPSYGFPFYAVKRITRDSNVDRHNAFQFTVELKNGKSFNMHNMGMSWTGVNGVGHGLISSPRVGDESQLRVLVSDPTSKKQSALLILDPDQIVSLEID